MILAGRGRQEEVDLAARWSAEGRKGKMCYTSGPATMFSQGGEKEKGRSEEINLAGRGKQEDVDLATRWSVEGRKGKMCYIDGPATMFS